MLLTVSYMSRGPCMGIAGEVPLLCFFHSYPRKTAEFPLNHCWFPSLFLSPVVLLLSCQGQKQFHNLWCWLSRCRATWHHSIERLPSPLFSNYPLNKPKWKLSVKEFWTLKTKIVQWMATNMIHLGALCPTDSCVTSHWQILQE